MPRTHSHEVGCTASNTVYSGVRTSNIGGLGGTMPLSAAALRAATRSSKRRPGELLVPEERGDHGMNRSVTTPSGPTAYVSVISPARRGAGAGQEMSFQSTLGRYR